MTPYVHLVDLETMNRKHECLNLQNSGARDMLWFGGPAVMSVEFSGDSREISCATKGGEILIYDLM